MTDRVRQFGEVKTKNNEIKNMLGLVNNEIDRVDSRFLEPACGDGNFLCEVLNRKMETIKLKHSKHQVDYEKYSIQSCSSIYGIEILDDNVLNARKRLNEVFINHYSKMFDLLNENIIKSVKKIFELNIVQGDALSFKCGKKLEKSIVLPEWSLIDNLLKRRDFAYKDFISYAPIDGPNLF
jgi:hypothetical protein